MSSFHRIPSCNITSRRSGISGRRRRSFAGWCACSPCCSPRRRPPTCRLLSREVTTPLGRRKPRVLKESSGSCRFSEPAWGWPRGSSSSYPRPRSGISACTATRSTLRPQRILQQVPGSSAGHLGLPGRPDARHGRVRRSRACEIIKAAGVPRLKLLSLIAAPEGIALINRAMPDVAIHVGAVDEGLNEVGFIYPGLGDAGDRQFGTGAEPSEA